MQNLYKMLIGFLLITSLQIEMLAQTQNGNNSGSGTGYERFTINSDNNHGGGQPQLRWQGDGEAWNAWYHTINSQTGGGAQDRLIFSRASGTNHRLFGEHLVAFYDDGRNWFKGDILTDNSIGLNGNKSIFSRNNTGFLYFQKFNWIVFKANGTGSKNTITFRSPIDNDEGNVNVNDHFVVRDNFYASNNRIVSAPDLNSNFPLFSGLGQVQLNGVVHAGGADNDLLFSDVKIRLFAWETENGLVVDGSTSEVYVQGMNLRARNNLYVEDISILGGVRIEGKEIETNDTGGNVEPLSFTDAQGVSITAGTFKVTPAAKTELASDVVKIGNRLETLGEGPLVLSDIEGVHITEGDLEVHNKIRTTDLDILPNKTSWPDYVFKSDYELRSLEEVAEFIDKNNHLPEVPSAEQVSQDGYNQSEMNALLLRKIEELTLHMIDMKRENQALQLEVKKLKTLSK